jgi:hypothetical protein
MRHLLLALLCLAQFHAQDEATRSLTLDARLLNLPIAASFTISQPIGRLEDAS